MHLDVYGDHDLFLEAVARARDMAIVERPSRSTHVPSDIAGKSLRARSEMNELAATLDGLAAFVRRYVVLSEAQLVAVVLWVAHTYAIDAAEQSPYLAVTSATKRSGKTRLLDVLELLVARAWRVISPSEAVVFRKLERRPADAAARRGRRDLEQGQRRQPRGASRDPERRQPARHRRSPLRRPAGTRSWTSTSSAPRRSPASAGCPTRWPTARSRSGCAARRRPRASRASASGRPSRPPSRSRISLASIMEVLVPELAEARPELPGRARRPRPGRLGAAARDRRRRRRRMAGACTAPPRSSSRATATTRTTRSRSASSPTSAPSSTQKETDRLATAALLEALAAGRRGALGDVASRRAAEPAGAGRHAAPVRYPLEDDSASTTAATPKGYLRDRLRGRLDALPDAEPDAHPLGSGFLSATPPQPASANGLRGSTYPPQTLLWRIRSAPQTRMNTAMWRRGG